MPDDFRVPSLIRRSSLSDRQLHWLLIRESLTPQSAIREGLSEMDDDGRAKFLRSPSYAKLPKEVVCQE